MWSRAFNYLSPLYPTGSPHAIDLKLLWSKGKVLLGDGVDRRLKLLLLGFELRFASLLSCCEALGNGKWPPFLMHASLHNFLPSSTVPRLSWCPVPTSRLLTHSTGRLRSLVHKTPGAESLASSTNYLGSCPHVAAGLETLRLEPLLCIHQFALLSSSIQQGTFDTGKS